MHKRRAISAVSLLAGIAVLATSALARPGGWDGPGSSGGWGRSGWDSNTPGRASASTSARPRADRSREDRVSVGQFVVEGDAAQALGHGAIVVGSRTEGEDFVGPGDRAAYEAAVVDQLVRAGYDTTSPAPTDGQIVELRILRSVAQAAEAPRKPVSGSAAMEVGTRGTAYGLAVNVDLTKPLPPLLATRLEARILDRASGKVLWEGRAELAAREGDARWSEQAIAGRLAEALFDGFPRASDRIAAPG